MKLLYFAVLTIGVTVACTYDSSDVQSDQNLGQAIQNCQVQPFGIATDFNVFALGNITQTNSDTEGRMAAAQNIVLQNYSVGSRLAQQQSRYDLVAGESLRFSSGSVTQGAAAYGTTVDISSAFIFGGAVAQRPIDFAKAKQELVTLSQVLSTFPTNGFVDVQYYGGPTAKITLRGHSQGLNVFNVASEHLMRANTLEVEVPFGSDVLVQSPGTHVTLRAFGVLYSGTRREHIVFHFPEAESIAIDSLGLEGTLLAPRATLNFNNGVIHGSAYVFNVFGTGQFNHFPYMGCLPRSEPPPAPKPTAPVQQATPVPPKPTAPVQQATPVPPKPTAVPNPGQQQQG